MRPEIVRALTGGFVGTLVMTVMMYVVAPAMLGLEMDIAAMLGSMLGGSWTAGLAMHFMLGSIVFPVIYASGLVGLLPGPAVVRGGAWAFALYLLAQLVVMPMMGAGLFSNNMGGLTAAMGSLMGHLAYGAVLGGIAGGVKA